MPEQVNVTIDGETGEEIERVVVVVPDDPEPPTPIADVFAAVPVVSLEEANDTLLALKAALEARGIV